MNKKRWALAGVFIALVILLNYPFFKRTPPPANPAGAKNDLSSIGMAEMRYLGWRGTYASLEQLLEAGYIEPSQTGRHHGYKYEVEVDGRRSFKITATPLDPAAEGLPTFIMDDSMQISEQ